jgi:DNA uptake protein ComE-like DNA-binding protein
MRLSRRGGFILALVFACAACGVLRGSSGGREPQPLDLNTASVQRVETLPGVTPSMARRIVAGRPYGAPDDLVERGVLSERELDRIRTRVIVEPAR